jgi:hypothetical protein
LRLPKKEGKIDATTHWNNGGRISGIGLLAETQTDAGELLASDQVRADKAVRAPVSGLLEF